MLNSKVGEKDVGGIRAPECVLLETHHNHRAMQSADKWSTVQVTKKQHIQVRVHERWQYGWPTRATK